MPNLTTLRSWVFAGFIHALASGPAFGLVTSWTNPASGHWEDSSWSLGLPGANQSVMITNFGYKAVGIFQSTRLNYPSSMTVSNLTILAPQDAWSTLLLNYPGGDVPLRVSKGCTIGTNGLLENLYGGVEISSGAFAITGGQFIQEGGTIVATNAITSLVAGEMNLTNADAAFGTLVLDRNDASIPSTATQSGGLTLCDLSIRAGSFTLLSGSLEGRASVAGPLVGFFIQSGGTNFASIFLGSSPYFSGGSFGTYSLAGGTVVSAEINVGTVHYAGGDFNQAGGLVSVQTLTLGSYSFRSFPGQGIYSLTNGTLLTGAENVVNGGFHQAGGQHSMSNGLSLFGNFDDYGSDNRSVEYVLWGGLLSCPSVNMGLYGSFHQSGGTNMVAGDLTFVNSTFSLSGGTLLTSNTVVAHGYFSTSDGYHFTSQFLHMGGQHHVSNTLSDLDQYFLSGGSLFANNIFLRGILSVSNGAAISNPGWFDFGGTFHLAGSASESLGQMLLSGDSSIVLATGTHTLTFLNSAALVWSNGVTLTITNWNGSTSGGGADRLIFGNNSGGLTTAQLRHIQFVNPPGFAAGYYPARMLATGELVPTSRPLLLPVRTGNKLILSWDATFVLQSSTNVQGPYADVSGATSPYTNIETQYPARFFRLRQ